MKHKENVSVMKTYLYIINIIFSSSNTKLNINIDFKNKIEYTKNI